MAENLDYLYKNPTPGINNNQGEIDTSWIGQMDPNKLFQQPGTTPTGGSPSDIDTSWIGNMDQKQNFQVQPDSSQPPTGGQPSDIDTSWIGKMDQKQEFGVKGGQPSDIDTSWIGTGEGLKPQSMQQPTQKPIAPNQGDFVFGKDAEMRNQQNPEYIMQRNQKIVDAIKGNRNVQGMSDEEIKNMTLDTIKGLGGDISNPEMMNTVSNITNSLRSTSPQYKSDDYFKMLLTNQPIGQTKGPDVADAYQRFQNYNKYSTFNENQLADSISAGELLIGSKARKDLQSTGYGGTLTGATKLLNLKANNSIKSYLISAMNVDKDASLESQTAQPIQTPNYEKSIAQAIFQGMQTDTVGDFRQYVSQNKDIVKARDNARVTREKMDALNINLRNIADDVKAQIIAGGGVATEGYLQALISEKSKPIIRQFEKLQAEYNSQTAVLSDLTDNSKLEFQYMQQDKENKMKGLQFLQGMYDKEQAQQFEQEKFKYQQQQDKLKSEQQKFDLKFDPITGQAYKFDPSTGQVTPVSGGGVGFSGFSGGTGGGGGQTRWNYTAPIPGKQAGIAGANDKERSTLDDAAKNKVIDQMSQQEGRTPGSRAYRNNNPTAMTTDVAKQGGLVEGIDYIKGEAFPNNPNLYTAKLLGDKYALTKKVIDNIGFTTGKKGGGGNIGNWNPQFESVLSQDSIPSTKELAQLGLSYGDYVSQKTAYQKANPGKGGKSMSGDASKLIGYSQSGLKNGEELLNKLSTMSVKQLRRELDTQDPRTMKLVHDMADAIIRLRSGGAATADEISNFTSQILPISQYLYDDKDTTIQNIKEIMNELQGNYDRMTTNLGLPSGTSTQSGGDIIIGPNGEKYRKVIEGGKIFYDLVE